MLGSLSPNSTRGESLWSSHVSSDHTYCPGHMCGFLGTLVHMGTFQNPYSSKISLPTFSPSLSMCLLFAPTVIFACSFISQCFGGLSSGIAPLLQENSKVSETKGGSFCQSFVGNPRQSKQTNTVPWEQNLLCSFQNQVPPPEMWAVLGRRLGLG